MSLASLLSASQCFHCPCGAADAGPLARLGDVEFTAQGSPEDTLPATAKRLARALVVKQDAQRWSAHMPATPSCHWQFRRLSSLNHP